MNSNSLIPASHSPAASTNPIHSAVFAGVPVRVFGAPDEPLFVAADVCRILEIINPSDALKSLDPDEKITLANPDGNPRAGIPHQLAAVTESGLYALIFKSRKPEAKAFRKWVTSEVLPAIRKTGSYFSAPKTLSEALSLALELEAKREQLAVENAALTGENERMKPKEEFYDVTMCARNGLLVRDAAKLIAQAVPGGIGERRLFKWLRENNWITRDNRPYQERVDAGHMLLTERPVITNSHGVIINVTPRITQKGLVLLFQRLAGMDKAGANKAVYGEEAA